jgi:hypothetical protein
MLPRKIPKPPKRATRWRSQAHCNFVRGHGCCVPECPDRPIEVAHVRRGSGAGVGQRPDDFYTISLCREHHAEQHRMGEVSFERRHRINMAELATEFAAQSPKRAEIERIQRERANG